MQISQVLKSAKEKLNQAKIETASLDALLLLCHCLQASKEQIIFNPQKEISQKEGEEFFQLIVRRALKEPVSYLIGKKEFYGLDFFVDENVLNPRPDSESLVELAIKEISNTALLLAQGRKGFVIPSAHSSNHENEEGVTNPFLQNLARDNGIELLELGSGSGCLIISILKNLDFANATAIDISKKALEITKKNAIFHEVQNRLELIKSDLFTELKTLQKFDFIISNPPYIRSEEIEKLDEEVKNFEPKLALDGGKSGLEFYQKIAEQAANYLKENGKIILEIGFDQKKDVIEIFTKFGFKLIAEKLDLAGRDRVLCFSKS